MECYLETCQSPCRSLARCGALVSLQESWISLTLGRGGGNGNGSGVPGHSFMAVLDTAFLLAAFAVFMSAGWPRGDGAWCHHVPARTAALWTFCKSINPMLCKGRYTSVGCLAFPELAMSRFLRVVFMLTGIWHVMFNGLTPVACMRNSRSLIGGGGWRQLPEWETCTCGSSCQVGKCICTLHKLLLQYE